MQTEVSITQFLLTINLKAYTALAKANAGVKNQHKFNFKIIQKCKGLVNYFGFMVIVSLSPNG